MWKFACGKKYINKRMWTLWILPDKKINLQTHWRTSFSISFCLFIFFFFFFCLQRRQRNFLFFPAKTDADVAFQIASFKDGERQSNWHRYLTPYPNTVNSKLNLHPKYKKNPSQSLQCYSAPWVKIQLIQTFFLVLFLRIKRDPPV